MKQALLFLWDQYISMILRINLALGLLILGVKYLIPKVAIFGSYLTMYPLFPIIFLLIYGYSLTTLYRNMALSFQCRRTDLFWGSQVAFLATGLGCALLTAVMGFLAANLLDLTAIMGKEGPLFQGGILWAKPEAIPVLLIAALTLQPMGAALGCLYEKHKIITTVILVVLMLLGVASTTLCLFIADGTLPISPSVILWTCVGFVALGLVGELTYYRSNKNAVVR
mgnify:FL=1